MRALLALLIVLTACGDVDGEDGAAPADAGPWIETSCVGRDEIESEQLALDCAARGGTCSAAPGGPVCTRE